MLEPQFVLLLAWALGHVVKDVQTAEYLAGVLGTGIPPYMLASLISVSRFREFRLSVRHKVCNHLDEFDLLELGCYPVLF